MATATYLAGRKKYGRPQAMLFSDNPGTLDGGFYVPQGTEFEDFLILSDHNREKIDFRPNRIENKVRTINGRMRSYHIADKLNISVSWDMLPSRAFGATPEFQSSLEASPGKVKTPAKNLQYTSDNGAGGVDLLNWYETYTGSFWVFLSYDKYTNLNGERDRLSEYSEVVEVFCNGFDYSIEKRGGSNHDFWNISLNLEEV